MQIEKNIPIPERATKRMSWPFKDMQVGDCVKYDDPSVAAIAQVRCHIYGRPLKMKFMTRTIDNVLHIWRIV